MLPAALRAPAGSRTAGPAQPLLTAPPRGGERADESAGCDKTRTGCYAASQRGCYAGADTSAHRTCVAGGPGQQVGGVVIFSPYADLAQQATGALFCYGYVH